jgi:hypothetical protein
VRREQGQKIGEHSPRPQTPPPALRPRTPEPRPPLRTPETHTLTGLEFLDIVTQQKPRPAAPTLQETEVAGNIPDIDVEQQLLGELAGGDSLPDGRLPDVPLPDVPLSDVPLPDVPLRDVPLLEPHPDCSVGDE